MSAPNHQHRGPRPHEEVPPSLFEARWREPVLGWLREIGATQIEAERLLPQVMARAQAQPDELAGGKVQGVLRRAVLDLFSAGLVQAALTGDTHATHRLLDAWQAEILRWCRWQCPRGVNHEDVAQDVMVAVLSRLHALREPERFRAWLWGVTWRSVQARKRKAWFWRWVPGDLERRGSAAMDPDDAYTNSERGQAVQQALDLLSPEHRQLLWLCYVEGQTRRELVELLGIPEGTLNRRLTAARRAFEGVARRHGLDPDGSPPAPEVVHG
jgi:RNA polymerase sigma-70 factor (ECF subfamily)